MSASIMPNLVAPLPDPGVPLAAQDSCVLLAMCIFGEARGDIAEAKVGVGCVVRNRVGLQGRYGHGFPGVILKPYQFSSFNDNDPNHSKLLRPLDHEKPEVWDACYTAAYITYWGSQRDITDGAVFYYSKPLKAPPRKKDGTLAWGSVEHTVDLGGLSFWKELR